MVIFNSYVKLPEGIVNGYLGIVQPRSTRTRSKHVKAATQMGSFFAVSPSGEWHGTYHSMVPFLSKIPIDPIWVSGIPTLVGLYKWVFHEFLNLLKPMNQVFFFPHRSHVASLNPHSARWWKRSTRSSTWHLRACRGAVAGFFMAPRERKKWLATFYLSCLKFVWICLAVLCLVFSWILFIFFINRPQHMSLVVGKILENDDQQVDWGVLSILAHTHTCTWIGGLTPINTGYLMRTPGYQGPQLPVQPISF